jgi:hypothetical protein
LSFDSSGAVSTAALRWRKPKRQVLARGFLYSGGYLACRIKKQTAGFRPPFRRNGIKDNDWMPGTSPGMTKFD